MEPKKYLEREKLKEFKCLLCGKLYIVTNETISDGCPHCRNH